MDSMSWAPSKKLIDGIDQKTREQQQRASSAKLVSEIQSGVGNHVSDRLAFFGEKNHFAEKLGRFFHGD